MVTKVEEQRRNIIQNLNEVVSKKLPAKQAKLVQAFIEQYYANTSLEDLLYRDIIDLFGATLSLWNLIYERAPGESKVHVYNPHFEQNGWQSTHTIIEISTDDMPFLIDSLRMAITRAGLSIHFTVHAGGMKLCRNSKHEVTAVMPIKTPVGKDVFAEAPIYFEVDRETDAEALISLHDNIVKTLQDVRLCNEDWPAMHQRALEAIQNLKDNPPPYDPTETEESIDFLEWIADNHFTFLGYREYKLIGEGEDQALELIPGSGLGVLRDETHSVKIRPLSFLPPSARRHVLSSHEILVLSETNKKSTVHRPAHTNYIGIKRFDSDQKLIGEARFIGLYTADAYHTAPTLIPFLRLKIRKVLKKSNFPPNGHAAKTLMNILETLPRDDLFQMSAEELTSLAMAILQLQERRRIRLFLRRDIYHRFISCFVYVPQDILSAELVIKMQRILEKCFESNESTFSVFLPESILGRINYVVRTDSKKPLHYDINEIEQELIKACRSWSDDLQAMLVESYGEEKANQLMNKYRNAFPTSYREDFAPRTAAFDIEHIEALNKEHNLGMIFYQPIDEAAGKFRFKLFCNKDPIPLSDVLPILENMGLRVIGEKPNEITLKDQVIWINDFGMNQTHEQEIDVDTIKNSFQEAFAKIWYGNAENDGFNRLVLSAGLTWEEISIFRAYTKYLRQTNFTFSQPYVEQAISSHPNIAKQIVSLFKTRFNPDETVDRTATAGIKQAILQALDQVTSLDEDRIIRRFVEIIEATLRTNYFQTNKDGKQNNYLVFKLNSKKIPELPLPYPMFEKFVYSPRFEGVHLRSSKVARGGIRWSDRPEDFRVEVLGLMKAQQVKNAVIVPSGAKGGFVPKYLPADRESLMKEVIDCYKSFISGLLDITDNIKNGKIIPPHNVVRYDDDDPYLVVAADKGTATFSDIANAISIEHDFWLGDAFASGGSEGYDHKKMGITARGAFESVKRHFRELNINPDEDLFTVVGVGDMSGDVFGNGMLISDRIKLVGAFNHLHIFIDPDPDPIKSFEERKRLFDLPNSTWADYHSKLISKGGGVFNRSEKSITLTPEIKQLLNVEVDAMVPNDLIRAILKAEVDLLWNGGIGTYVKATSEINRDVGDRTNDNLRINGHELRCKAVGEGGNLGFTQLGRVEYELNGGLIYTDFIDNSGGVNCSDHEVNIKILLNQIVKNGDLTEKQRNQLLVEMTDEVAQLVLKTNYYQPKAISHAAAHAAANLELYSWYIDELEQNNKIDRALEFLPDNKTLLERKSLNKGLTRPELAVLLSYSKMLLKEELLKSTVPEDPYFERMLELEFPTPIRKKFLKQMKQHSLRREIIGTQLSNLITNEMGATFVDRLHDETGSSVPEIVKSYTAARTIFNIREVIHEMETIDNNLSAAIESNVMTDLYRLMRRATRWLIRHCEPGFNIQAVIDKFAPSLVEFAQHVDQWLIGSEATNLIEQMSALIEAGVPHELASKIARTNFLFPALDIIEIAKKTGASLDKVAMIYFSLGENLELDWLRNLILAHPVENHWDALARAALRDDLDWQQKYLTLHVLKINLKGTTPTLLNQWTLQNQALLERWQAMLTDLRRSNNPNFIMFFVAVRELMDLGKINLEH